MESTSGERPSKLIPEKVIGYKSKMREFTMDPKLSIIYALSIGFNEDQLNKSHFKFTYELNDEFTVFPTYATVIAIDLADFIGECPGIPDFNMMGLLHGEEWVEFYKPLPTSGVILYECEVVDVEDKGKGTVVSIGVRIYSKEDQKSPLAVIFMNLFIRGLKGEGVKSVGPLKNVLPKPPTSEPVKQVTYKTYPNQALYYRIGGNDPNPLHVDPDMSSMGGFEKPILHGMCTYGMAGRAIYELFCDGKIENLAALKVRLTSHVIPGESLTFQFWKGKESGSIILAVKNVERGTTVMVGEAKLRNSKF